MQKLEKRNTFIPTGVQSHLACSSMDLSLNRDQSLSEQVLKTSSNNLEGVQPQHRVEKNLRVSSSVYVFNKRGQSLMPTTPRKAKQLLKEGKAKVIKRLPFTIQLTIATGETKQSIKLGVDSGAKFIGFSAVTEKKEVISGTLNLDLKTSSRLKEKTMYRRGRRNKLWYRKPRFNNRKGQELPPSVRRKYQTHLSLINRIKKLLPITLVNIEVGNFDIQKIQNPEIQGTDYQQGSRFGYENTKAFIMAREKCLCQLCQKSVLGSKINLHHIIQRKDGGSDRVSNLALLHHSCHEKLHKNGLKLKPNKQFKEPTFMNIIKKRLQSKFDTCFGFETFCKRLQHNIPKSHSNDAFVISGGNRQIRIQEFKIVQKHKHNRAIQLNRKGYQPSIRTSIYKIQPHDLVKIGGRYMETSGVHNNGTRVMINKKSFNIKLVEKVYNFGNLIWRTAIPQLS